MSTQRWARRPVADTPRYVYIRGAIYYNRRTFRTCFGWPSPKPAAPRPNEYEYKYNGSLSLSLSIYIYKGLPSEHAPVGLLPDLPLLVPAKPGARRRRLGPARVDWLVVAAEAVEDRKLVVHVQLVLK